MSPPSAPLGLALPLWSVLPFALLLLAIALLPMAAGRFWEHNRNKLALSLVLGLPVALWMASLDRGVVLHAAHEYAAFVILLGALFVISGGIVVRGTLAGTPGLNTGLLAAGALLASLVGTTGASMVLVRPLVRANSIRSRKVHVFVFFIFVVGNAGGLLTPLGDPPLLLGFLRGVPFLWTLRLWPVWLLHYVVDSTIFRQEDLATPGDLDKAAVRHRVPIHVVGRRNLLYLAGVVAVIALSGAMRFPQGAREGALLLLALLSWVTTPRAYHAENRFDWSPILEVAALFAGLFATMVPALEILNARGAQLGLERPLPFFWATGLLSSVLDNAPTYLAFTSAASGLLGTSGAHLQELLQHARGAELLAAISAGSVLMGANSYVGNGPNIMVKAIAEREGVRMPGFFGYMAWAGAVLLPLFALVGFLFFA